MQAELMIQEFAMVTGVALDGPGVQWGAAPRRSAVDNANDPLLQAKVGRLRVQLAELRQLAQGG